MKKIVMGLISVVVFSLTANALSIGQGFMNNKQVEFQIKKSGDLVKFVGDLGLGAIDFTISRNEYIFDYRGIIHGQKTEMSVQAQSNKITFAGIYNNQFMDMSIEQNSSSSRFSGKNSNRELSTLVAKDIYGTTHVSGFYKKDLYDLYVYEVEGEVIFEGYANGYWTNLKIKNNSESYFIHGKFANSDVQLTLTKGSIELNEFIEFILFGFFVPNHPIILIK